MSLNIVDQTTGDLTPIAGNATDKVGNLSALTTTDKSSCVGAINEVNNRTSKLPDFPNAVNISSYTPNNYYVAPKDGFIRIQIPPGQCGFGCIFGTRVIGGRNNSTGTATADNYLVFSTQVRKGCNLALNTLGTTSPDVVLEFIAYQAN